MSTTTVVVPQQVIHDRLKNGQCIHCGIQTHHVVKKFGRSSEKIPMNIAGKVDYGRCLDSKCRESSIHVTMSPSSSSSDHDAATRKPSIRLSGVATGMAAVGTGAALSALGIPIIGDVISAMGQSYAEVSLSSVTTADLSSSSTSNNSSSFHDSCCSSSHHQPIDQSSQTNMSDTAVLQQQQSASLAANQQILQGLQTTANQQYQANQPYDPQRLFHQNQQQQPKSQPVAVCTMCPSDHQASLVLHYRECVCDICQRMVPFGESVYHCSICEWDACSSCSQAKAQTAVITTKCPSNHQVPRILNQQRCLCNVCSRLIPLGEFSFHCSICDWDTCSMCQNTYSSSKAKQTTTTSTTTITTTMCPSHHQVRQIANTHRSMCNVCHKMIPVGKLAFHCSICDWDACSHCGHPKEEETTSPPTATEKPKTTAVTMTLCPSKHQIPQIIMNHHLCVCDVCQRNIPMGELVFHCSTCDWDACSMCHHQEASPAETTAVTMTFCPSKHQVPQIVNHRLCWCDVCKRSIPMGELTFHCSTCDWDSCSLCHHQKASPTETAAVTMTLCPYKHQAPQIVNQRSCVCDVCQSNIPTGELVFHCSTCDWDACSRCNDRSAQPAEVTTTGICPANHQTSNKWNDRSCLCDVCKTNIPLGESILHCSICDWDSCLMCHEMKVHSEAWCPSHHQAPTIWNDGPCVCNVCKRTISKGSLVSRCYICDWDSCSACHHHQSTTTAQETTLVTTICPSHHEAQLIWSHRPCVCDVCKRMITIDEMIFHCPTCDWDACSMCDQQEISI